MKLSKLSPSSSSSSLSPRRRRARARGGGEEDALLPSSSLLLTIPPLPPRCTSRRRCAGDGAARVSPSPLPPIGRLLFAMAAMATAAADTTPGRTAEPDDGDAAAATRGFSGLVVAVPAVARACDSDTMGSSSSSSSAPPKCTRRGAGGAAAAAAAVIGAAGSMGGCVTVAVLTILALVLEPDVSAPPPPGGGFGTLPSTTTSSSSSSAAGDGGCTGAPATLTSTAASTVAAPPPAVAVPPPATETSEGGSMSRPGGCTAGITTQSGKLPTVNHTNAKRPAGIHNNTLIPRNCALWQTGDTHKLCVRADLTPVRGQVPDTVSSEAVLLLRCCWHTHWQC